jgi:DNA mismatch repair protein MutL
MGRIRVLPDNIINRIAAGEVVERPASVVKELIENSVDAGAAAIEVRLEQGGRTLVEVRDDGCGMDADDAVAALERHATSKLTASSSLDRILTMGFRGEALPSIAAVSRFTLSTSTGDGAGTRVVVDGGRILSTSPSPHPRGTTVAIRDLFFNTPARRRFLRTPGTEMGHVVELFSTLALSRPDIGLRLEHAGRRLFDLPSAPDRFARLSQIEGAEEARASVPVTMERGGMTISGYILVAGEVGATRGGRRIVVNGRVVRDRILSSAISRALQESLPAGAGASVFLVLQIPVDGVDVNVHPAKLEVRFSAPGAVHDLVRDALRAALAEGRPLRSGPIPASLGGIPGSWDAPAVTREALAEARRVYAPWTQGPPAAAMLRSRPLLDDPMSAPSIPGQGGAQGDEPASEAPVGTPRVVGHYRSGYILAEDDEGLLLVDQHAAHERILFEQMSFSDTASGSTTQALLFTRTVTLPSRLRGRGREIGDDLASLGFEVEPFGEDTLIVRAVPSPLGETDPERLVLEIVAGSDDEGDISSGMEGRRRRMLATAACHAAVKVPAHLTPEKIEYILATLLRCRSPLRCPHGRPTILRWGHRSIELRFGRP